MDFRIRLKIFAESLKETFIIVRDSGLFKATGGILLITFLAAFAVLFFEMQHPGANMVTDPQESFVEKIGDAIWWAIITMTTVGYGDKYPVTTGGRLVGVFVAFSGVALVSLFTATISSVLIAQKIKEGKGLQNIHWKDHILVCGWNFNVEPLLLSFESLIKDNPPGIVLLNEVQEDIMHDVILRHKKMKLKFVRGDFSHETTLKRANVESARAAIILPDASLQVTAKADDKTLLTVLTAKSINPKIKVYAHVLDPNSSGHIRHANVDEFILRDEHTGFLLANHVLAPGVPQLFDELMNLNKNHKIQTAPIPEKYAGEKITALRDHFKTAHNAIFLGLVSDEEPFNVRELLTDKHSYLDAYIERKLSESGRGTGQRQKTGVTINPPDDYIIESRDQALILIQTAPENKVE